MSDHDNLIQELATEYDEMTEYRDQRIQEFRAEAKRQEAALREDLEKSFALKIVTALNMGVKRSQLARPVLRTNDNEVWKKWVTLGGGTIRPKISSEQRTAERKAVTNARRDELMSALGLKFLAVRDFMGRGEFPHFEVLVDGSQVYLDMGTVWPVGNAGKTYHDLRVRKEEIKELGTYYEEDEK